MLTQRYLSQSETSCSNHESVLQRRDLIQMSMCYEANFSMRVHRDLVHIASHAVG